LEGLAVLAIGELSRESHEFGITLMSARNGSVTSVKGVEKKVNSQ
jgi:hypothetical protein